MARYNIDEIINNANSQKKKKKRYDIDEILNNANNISKSSSITKTNISTPNIRLNNEDKNFWGNVGNMSNKMLQEAIKVEEQRNFAKELLKNSISNVKNINLGDGFVKASSAFDDGYQFGDVSKTILSTTGDVALNVGKGIMNIGEGIGDLATYGIAGIADLTGNDEYADKLRYNASNMNVVDDLTKPVSDFVDKNSVLGDKADEIAQGLGYVAGNTAMSILTGGLGAKLGISSKIAQTAGSMGTTFSSSMGHGMSEAYQNGATDDEAFAYGIISAAGETGSELMFGGLGKASKAVGLSKGAGELDDIVIGGLTKNIKNKMAKTLVQSGLKAGGEGAEEVVSGLISAVGKKLTYMSEEELGQILKDENLAEQFWMGALTSAIAQSPSTISSIKNRTDYITGEKYNDIQKNNAPELAQNHQNNERQQTILNDIKMPQNQNKPQLDDMLNNKELPMQKYVYEKSNNIKINNLRQDANKYFNNSEKAHNYMQMLEKIIEDKNIDIRLDANLKTPDGRTANGSYSNGVMTINPNSAKAGEFIAVHELTHAIGTKDMLNIVENYRKNNKEFNSEVERLLQNYNSTEITEEALSDVSAQLFGNQEFINNISQNNPNIFQKIYSEIKYLWHQFRGYKNQDQFVEDLYYKWTQAYNSNNKLNNTTSYHISKNLSNDIDNVLKNINERNPVRLRDYTPSVLVNNGIKNLPMYENPAHIRKNILTESEARKAGLSINTRDHYHGLGKEVYIKAIDSLDKPRVIFKNNTNNEYLILTVIKDKNNNNVIVPIEIETNTKVNNVTIDINRVKTVYGYKEQNNIDLNDYIKHNIKKNKFAKIYEQKKEKGTGFSTVANSNTSIPSSSKDVNTTTKYSIQENENNSLKIEDDEIKYTNNEGEDRNLYFRFDWSKEDFRGSEHKSKLRGYEIEAHVDYMFDDESLLFDTNGYYLNTYRELKEQWYNDEISEQEYDDKLDALKKEYIEEALTLDGASSFRLDEDGIEFSNIYEYYDRPIVTVFAGIESDMEGHDGEAVARSEKVIWQGDSDILSEIFLDDDLTIEEKNKELMKIFTNSSDTKYSKESKTWQQYLDKNFKSTGTRTNLEDVRQIAPYKNDKNVSDSKAKIAPTKTGIDTMETNKTGQKETNIDRFNKYKRNIVKASEETINNLISYKNVTARSIDNKIAEKQRILNSKKNKDTKLANTIKSQIENLKLQKTEIENLYNEKIDKFNSKISKEKIELEVRNKMKQEARKALNVEIEPLIKDLTQYKDKKAGILYNRETAQRNIDDIVQDKDLASAIKQTIFDPVQIHQAEKTREINNLFKKINDLDLDKTKKYYYVPKNEIAGVKVDEATLAQLIIEKKITDTNLRNYGLDDVGIEKIHKTADTFTEILDYLYDKMNEEQIKYGYSPIGKIENYFPHFLENKTDNTLGKIASYFGVDLTNQSLPTEIAGKTDTFKPGRTWDSNIQKRRTNKTDYDALVAMEKYINGAADLIYTTDDIQRIREYARQIRYKYSDKGIQSEIDNIINNNELTQEAKDLALDGIFKNTENELSNFVTWLDDYANTLANKKAFADRNMERNIGRNMYNSMSGIESRIAANTIGGNLSVSLTNFAPIFQAAGTTKWNYLLTGMLQTTSNNIKGMIGNSKDTSFVTNSNFLTNRFGTDTISQKKITKKISDIASMPINAIDEFASESIVRAKYLENIDKGMTEEKALDSADKYAAKIMADRSKGALPIIFNTKNPISKLMTMFQTEPNNMISNYLKDMPRDAKGKSQLIGQATKLMVASWAFNTIAMSIRGGNEVLPDPIRWVSYLIKGITGDDDEKEKARTDLTESVLGSIPFLSNLAGFVGVEDIGRIPISNAMPNITNLVKLTDGEADSKYKWETAVKEFSKPLIYLGLPVGGAQIKKTIEGIATVSNGGSYRTNKDGEKELQFPVENPNIGDYIKAGIFGKYSLSDSKAYADRGYKTLSAKQTKMYEEANIPYRELLDYLDAGLKKTEDKIEYISSKKMNTNQKWGIYTNDIFSKTERNDGGSQLSDAKYITSNGVSKKDFIEIYNKAQEHNIDIPTADEYKEMQNNEISLEKYMDYQVQVKQITNQKRNNGELSETQSLKSKDKIQILLDSSYSNKEIKAIYENYIKSENDSEYNIMNKTGIKIKEYLKYKQQDFSSDSADDGTTKGKTVSGSSKVKTYEYVNKMNITYEQRLMLLGMKYTLTDTEQTRLYNYVKSLNCTTEERQDILEKLKGFTVYKNGRVTW